MNPETLQTLGVLAIGLGFVLIGLGGFSTYQASQKIQHTAELREAEKKGEYSAEILALLIKNQELQRKIELTPAPAPATPPAAPSYFRPPSPPPPSVTVAQPAPPPAAEPVPSQSVPEPTIPQTPEVAVTPEKPVNGAPEEWHEPDSFRPDVTGRYLSSHQRHTIADTLRAHGRHTVTIESSYGDTVSREYARELGSAFAEADWLVRGIDEHRGLPLASGVTISAGSFPPQQETRAVYEALLSAGIAVTQQLDPRQKEIETIVLVGAPL